METRDTSSPQRIGIAVVEYADHFLVGTRTSDSTLAGLAEFPGGKCRPDESQQVCAVRECLEETGLAVAAVELLDRSEFAYEFAVVDLAFWRCDPLLQSSQRPPSSKGIRGNFRWVSRNELARLSFPPANVAVLEKLCST